MFGWHTNGGGSGALTTSALVTLAGQFVLLGLLYSFRNAPQFSSPCPASILFYWGFYAPAFFLCPLGLAIAIARPFYSSEAPPRCLQSSMGNFSSSSYDPPIKMG